MLIKPWQTPPRTVEVAVRTTVAAIAGALLATLGMAVVQTRMDSQGPPAETSSAWTGLPGQAQPVGLSTSGLATAAAVTPMVVRCAPGQQAVLSQTYNCQKGCRRRFSSMGSTPSSELSS